MSTSAIYVTDVPRMSMGEESSISKIESSDSRIEFDHRRISIAEFAGLGDLALWQSRASRPPAQFVNQRCRIAEQDQYVQTPCYP